MGRAVNLICLLVIVSSGAIAETPSTTPSTQRQQALLHLLKHDCGSCHGMMLKGGLGPALLPQNLLGKSDDFLQQTILNGRVRTAMPPWRDLLSEPEVRWLLERLRQGINDE